MTAVVITTLRARFALADLDAAERTWDRSPTDANKALRDAAVREYRAALRAQETAR